MFERCRELLGGAVVALVVTSAPGHAGFELAEPYLGSSKTAATVACTLFVITFVLQKLARRPSMRSDAMVVKAAGVSVILMMASVVASVGLFAIAVLKAWA